MHLGTDDPAQPLVAGQAEQIIDMVGLAPAHQFFSAEARVGPQHEAHLGPALTQLGHDTFHLFDRTCGRVVVGGPEPRAQ